MRKMSLSSRETDKQAVSWACKLDAGPLAPDEEASLEQWLASDVRHPGALGRAVACLARVDRLGAVGVDASNFEEPPIWTRRWLVMGGGAAVGLAAATVAGVTLWHDDAQGEFVTKIGESCTVSLSDGSVVILNTDSKLTVGYSARERVVNLARGEALFHVAKDKKRPFIVVAGDTQIRAVGTIFNVLLLPKRPVQILVQEGVVEVTRPDAPSAPTIRATAGTQTVALQDRPLAPRAVSAPQVSRSLAWQYGRLEFNNKALADAAEEFSRYSGTKITVDPSVADRTITGSFVARDPVGFARATADVLDLRIELKENQVRIYE